MYVSNFIHAAWRRVDVDAVYYETWFGRGDPVKMNGGGMNSNAAYLKSSVPSTFIGPSGGESPRRDRQIAVIMIMIMTLRMLIIRFMMMMMMMMMMMTIFV
jgi:hypothetical protein